MNILDKKLCFVKLEQYCKGWGGGYRTFDGHCVEVLVSSTEELVSKLLVLLYFTGQFHRVDLYQGAHCNVHNGLVFIRLYHNFSIN